MKTTFGFIAGLCAFAMVYWACNAAAWMALLSAGLMALNLWLSAKVDQ